MINLYPRYKDICACEQVIHKLLLLDDTINETEAIVSHYSLLVCYNIQNYILFFFFSLSVAAAPRTCI